MKWQESLQLGCADATEQVQAWVEIERWRDTFGCDDPQDAVTTTAIEEAELGRRMRSINQLEGEVKRLEALINQAGVIARKKNRDVLRALRQMSGNPDEHYIPPVTLAERARKAEDTVQKLAAEVARLQEESERKHLRRVLGNFGLG